MAFNNLHAMRRATTEVTADRIGDHLYNPAFDGRLSGREREVLSEARSILMRLAGFGDNW
jgi:hypothetical protein